MKSKSNYAVMTGIQIYPLDANYIWPVDSYVVIAGKKQVLNIA
jgi:hypothetical protein